MPVTQETFEPRLWKGPALPITRFPGGYFTPKDTYDLIWASIMMILGTRIGTTIMLPEFGCFTGDTLVPLLSGDSVPLGDLVGVPSETYGCDGGHIVPVTSPGAVFQGNRRVIRVHLDDGTHLDCTPGHLFLLRDGEYREAGRLKPGDRLMPLHRKRTKRGYEMVYVPAEQEFLFTHRLFCPAEPGNVVHHANFDKHDNRPSNLVEMEKMAHLRFHAENVKKMFEPGGPLHRFWNSSETAEQRKRKIRAATKIIQKQNQRFRDDPAFRARCQKSRQSPGAKASSARIFRDLWKDPYFREWMTEHLCEIRKQWWADHPEYKEIHVARMRESRTLAKWVEENREAAREMHSRVGKEYGSRNLIKYARSKEGRARARSLGLARLKDVSAEQILKFAESLPPLPSRELVYQAVEEHFGLSRSSVRRRVPLGALNHKVVGVECLPGFRAVYDLVNCSPTSNYPVGSGVFVHNSGLPELVHEQNDGVTRALAKQYTSDAIQRWEPRVTVIDTQVITSDVELQIVITFCLKGDSPLNAVTRGFVVRRHNSFEVLAQFYGAARQ